ncbi:MAG: MBL fold metallo-hydrolase [Bacillus sp. (in: firmicutes)]
MDKNLMSERNTFKQSFLPFTSVSNRKWDDSMKGMWVYTSRIVNLYYVQNDEGDIVMIDAGMPKQAKAIKHDFREKFQKDKPVAIILTHGHFDHVGSLAELLQEWEIPVFAHELELPFLNGEKDYPRGKVSKKGLVSMISFKFPNYGINLATYIKPLPENHSVPFLAGWKWIFTPGHTPGHVSLYNEEKRVLIAGDAFTTTKQESLLHVITQKFEINGAPAYFTMDEETAGKTIKKLAELQFDYCVTGHGRPMKSRQLIKQQMEKLMDMT